jgi:hypothetical protein
MFKRLVAGFPTRRPGFKVRSYGICGWQSGTGAGFLLVLGFPCKFSFHRLLHTQVSTGDGTIDQILADVPNGLSLTTPQKFKRKGKGKGKATPLTGHGGPLGCETSRLPHFLNNRLTYGRKVVSPRRRPPVSSQEDSWYSFLLEAESTPGSQCGWKD